MADTTSAVPSLLPCPFCGGVPSIKHGKIFNSIVCPPGPCKGTGLVFAFDFGEEETSKAIAAWNRRALQPACAAQRQPVAGQCRFAGAQWSECATEHIAMVLANPAEWEGYEVRYLYAAPQPVAREPLTEDAIVDAFCVTPGLSPRQMVGCFLAGARFAERAHGITGDKA